MKENIFAKSLVLFSLTLVLNNNASANESNGMTLRCRPNIGSEGSQNAQRLRPLISDLSKVTKDYVFDLTFNSTDAANAELDSATLYIPSSARNRWGESKIIFTHGFNQDLPNASYYHTVSFEMVSSSSYHVNLSIEYSQYASVNQAEKPETMYTQISTKMLLRINGAKLVDSFTSCYRM